MEGWANRARRKKNKVSNGVGDQSQLQQVLSLKNIHS